LRKKKQIAKRLSAYKGRKMNENANSKPRREPLQRNDGARKLPTRKKSEGGS
jgi:hypothetical protein